MNIKTLFFAVAAFCGVFALTSFGNVAHAKKGIKVTNASSIKIKLKYYFIAVGCSWSKKCGNNHTTDLPKSSTKALTKSFPNGTSNTKIVVYCKNTSGGWADLGTWTVKQNYTSKTISASKVSSNKCAAQ